MSLDLYIISKEPVCKRGTGIFIRENGQNRELHTVEEVRDYFPDADIGDVVEQEYETDRIWENNITHNMREMVMHVPIREHNLYKYLWRPEEIGINYVTVEYASAIAEGLSYLKSHHKELRQYNPPVDPETGYSWGSYDQLVEFCTSLSNCLNELDCKNNEYQICAYR